MKRRGDHRGTRQREQLVFRADENADAVAAFGSAQQFDDVLLCFEIGEKQPDPFEILDRGEVLEQIGLPSDDQLRTMRWGVAQLASPASTSRAVNSPSSASASLREASISILTSCKVRPLIRALRKLPASLKADGGSPAGICRMRFSTEPSSATSTARARSGSIRTNSTCLSRAFSLEVTTTPAPRSNLTT